ncbi:hypothetical protein LFTC9L10_ODKFFKCD_01908 [Limosilactobacillus fermentum]
MGDGRQPERRSSLWKNLMKGYGTLTTFQALSLLLGLASLLVTIWSELRKKK